MKKTFSEFVKECQKVVEFPIVQYPVNDLVVDVKVLEYTKTWGCERVLIEPVSGSGQRWVNITSLRGI